MKITLITVGKIKEKFYRDAIAEYSKRLSRYCSLEILELPDEKTPDGASEALETQIKEKEGQRILGRLPEHAYIVALCIDGKQRDSVGMARWMEDLTNHGQSHIVFIIGGSCGLSPQVIAQADEKISEMIRCTLKFGRG